MTSAVPDLMVVPELSSDLAGAVTWWRLSGTCQLSALVDTWAHVGSCTTNMPVGVSSEVAMHRALESIASKNETVRPLAGRKGLVLVAETFGPDGRPSYTYGAEVRYTDAGIDVIAGPQEGAIVAAFHTELETLRASDVGSLLSRWVGLCHAVPLRDTGGIYFVPAATLPTWRRCAAVIHSATSHQVHELPAVRSAEAVAAVVDALTREVDAANSELLAELSDDRSLGIRALRTREMRCRALADKLGVYEAQLGTSLDALRAKTATTTARVAAAVSVQLAAAAQ